MAATGLSADPKEYRSAARRPGRRTDRRLGRELMRDVAKRRGVPGARGLPHGGPPRRTRIRTGVRFRWRAARGRRSRRAGPPDDARRSPSASCRASAPRWPTVASGSSTTSSRTSTSSSTSELPRRSPRPPARPVAGSRLTHPFPSVLDGLVWPRRARGRRRLRRPSGWGLDDGCRSIGTVNDLATRPRTPAASRASPSRPGWSARGRARPSGRSAVGVGLGLRPSGAGCGLAVVVLAIGWL